MSGVRARNESAWLLPNDGTRTNHQLRQDMRRFADSRRGRPGRRRLRRRRLDAAAAPGPRGLEGRRAGRRPVLGSGHRLGQRRGRLAPPVLDRAARDLRRRSGAARLEQLRPRRRRVDGALRRLHPALPPQRLPRPSAATGSARTGPSTTPTCGRYYQAIEEELPVAGEKWPWGDPHSYPYRPHPVGGNGEVFLRGADKLGITAKVGPVAIVNGRFGNRPHCIYRGFCLQGCKVNAKASPLITHIPDALAHGAEVRADCMVTRVEVDERTGRATGVHYVRDGVPRFQKARMVAIAGYSIETPRLLLNSASRRFPDGLCNDFDQVGRYLMVQGAPQTAGRFDAEVRMYKSPPPEVSTEEFYETDPSQALQARVLHPDRLAAADHLGRARRRAGPLGRSAARVHERLRALVQPGRAVRVPAPAGQPGHPGRGEGPPRPAGRQLLLLPVRQRHRADEGRTVRHGRHPARGRRRRGDHHRPVRPPRRRRPDGSRRTRTASSTPTAAASPCPTSTSPTAACCPPRAAPTPP